MAFGAAFAEAFAAFSACGGRKDVSEVHGDELDGSEVGRSGVEGGATVR